MKTLREKTVKNAFGTFDIARICQVTPPTVGRWIAEGKLPSFTTGGGHHRVWRKDLAAFLEAHNMPVPSELRTPDRLTILIVDDEAAVRKFIEKIIKGRFPEAEIHQATDGFEAGHQLISLSPSLVILDLNLPGIDGMKVCEMIRQKEELRDVKVLAITGGPMKGKSELVLGGGMEGFLEKPFDSEKMTRQIEKILSGRPARE